jgi:hypothetical protein
VLAALAVAAAALGLTQYASGKPSPPPSRCAANEQRLSPNPEAGRCATRAGLRQPERSGRRSR